MSDQIRQRIMNGERGKYAEEKMNKYNNMLSSLQEKVKEEREKFYKEHGTPNYKKGAAIEIISNLFNENIDFGMKTQRLI